MKHTKNKRAETILAYLVLIVLSFLCLFFFYILEQARHSAQTGEPIVRAMDYMFPGEGFEECNDQYMLGDKYLVVPQKDVLGLMNGELSPTERSVGRESTRVLFQSIKLTINNKFHVKQFFRRSGFT